MFHTLPSNVDVLQIILFSISILLLFITLCKTVVHIYHNTYTSSRKSNNHYCSKSQMTTNTCLCDILYYILCTILNDCFGELWNAKRMNNNSTRISLECYTTKQRVEFVCFINIVNGFSGTYPFYMRIRSQI